LEGSGRKSCDIIVVPSGYLPVGLRKATVGITGGPPKTPTENLQNTNEEHQF
jgi:hypothetical protein